MAAARRGLGLERLWERGGYPSSLLARSGEGSRAWRDSYARTYLDRDLSALGLRVSAAQLRRFWQMLAHWHGELWNASAFARNFDVTAPTVPHYLDLLTDTFVVRQLQPFHANLEKRLVKSPKVYVRDSGMLHTLLGIKDLEALHGHPKLGASFEGFVIEQALALLPPDVDATFFRTHTGDEIDLVLSASARKRIAVEVKLSSAPKLSDGLCRAMDDVGAKRGFVVMTGREPFPLSRRVEAMPLGSFLEQVVLPLRDSR
jgi:predicted AAA+ superfamily ATPase